LRSCGRCVPQLERAGRVRLGHLNLNRTRDEVQATESSHAEQVLHALPFHDEADAVRLERNFRDGYPDRVTGGEYRDELQHPLEEPPSTGAIPLRAPRWNSTREGHVRGRTLGRRAPFPGSGSPARAGIPLDPENENGGSQAHDRQHQASRLPTTSHDHASRIDVVNHGVNAGGFRAAGGRPTTG
jgi:hypothetical protein